MTRDRRPIAFHHAGHELFVDAPLGSFVFEPPASSLQPPAPSVPASLPAEHDPPECGRLVEDCSPAWQEHLDTLGERLAKGLPVAVGRGSYRNDGGFAAAADVEREIAERREKPATEPRRPRRRRKRRGDKVRG